MTKQEETREGVILILQGVSLGELNEYEALKELNKLGVVVKVDRELPHKIPAVPNNEWSAGYSCGEEFMQEVMVEHGYTAWESLI